jgi:hypothetical protein
MKAVTRVKDEEKKNMTPRNFAMIAIGCIAAGALLLSYWPDDDHLQVVAISALQRVPAADQPVLVPPSAPPSDEGAAKGSETPLEQSKPVQSGGPIVRNEFAAFEAMEDRDSALSRELEAVVQLAGRYALNDMRGEVQAIKCRSSRCLLALVSNNVNDKRAHPSSVAPILAELEKTPPRNPSTGEVLFPNLQMVATPTDTQGPLLVELSFNGKKR